MTAAIDQQITVAHADWKWTASHDPGRFGGPESICLGRDRVVSGCRMYVDDLDTADALIESQRLRRRGGCAVVESRGRFPFGAELHFSQVCRYAANHVSVTADFNWPRGFPVRRHFGLGSLLLPGRWARFFVVPPALHLAQGVTPAWQEVPDNVAAGTMIAHWHRPPLALVFERSNGTRIEIGVGDDVWRWEQNLGCGMENGSYKVVTGEDGLQVIREPLMCCTEFLPAARQYRFKWYMAWDSAALRGQIPEFFTDAVEMTLSPARKVRVEQDAAAAVSLDFNRLPWPQTALAVPSPFDFVRGKVSGTPCWESNPARNLARAVIRQLAEHASIRRLGFRNVNPTPCWNPAHVGPAHPDGVVHWDIGSLIDFAVWTRQQLGDDWDIAVSGDLVQDLPSLTGLFGPNGFSTGHEEE